MAYKSNNLRNTDLKETAQREIERLLARVEMPINEWIKTKGYRLRSLTISKTAKHIGISEADLRLYLNIVVKGSLNSFLGPLRVEDAKTLMIAKGGELDENEYNKVGFSSVIEYFNMFKKVEGMYPSTWALEESAKKSSFKKQHSVIIQEGVERVKKAIGNWERNMEYRKPNLTAHTVAKELRVSDDDLYYYCCLELHDTIENWIEQQRIYDARIILRSEPQKRISSISSMLGYITEFSFRNSFEKLTGVTPESWRGENKQSPIIDKGESDPQQKQAFPFDIEPILQWKRKKGYCQSNLSLKDVARAVGFSEARFSQYLKKVESNSFQNWISTLRMEEAKRLLSSNSPLTVSQIASKVGIPNIGTFRAFFIHHTGMTPDGWRKNASSE